LERNEDSLPNSGVFYVYILRCGDGALYTGYTNDLEARLAAHRNGKGAKYTRGRGPLELVYKEALGSNIAAMKREREIQKQTRAQKERLIRGETGDPLPRPPVSIRSERHRKSLS
jgi:putative endonuclease